MITAVRTKNKTETIKSLITSFLISTHIFINIKAVVKSVFILRTKVDNSVFYPIQIPNRSYVEVFFWVPNTST